MRTVSFLTLVLAMTLIWGCGEQQGGADAGSVLAKVGGQTITEESFEQEVSYLPPFQRKEMETPQGKEQFLDRLIEMELLYLAATDAGFAEEESLAREIERARRQILMRHYYKNEIEAKALPGEDEINAYFQENIDDFSVKERIRGRMILSENKSSSRKIKGRLNDGESFAALAASESVDKPTAGEDGDLGWFTRDGYVRSIGVRPEFTKAVFNLEPGEVSSPIEIEGKGWALVKVEEREPAGTKEIAEVRDDIVRRLTPTVRENFYKASLKTLREKYNVEIFGEPFVSNVTPEELFEMAQNAKDSDERIKYYRRIADEHSDFEQADRALFMVGFVHSEERGDKQAARTAFLEFLQKFPESDLAKDAQYMLDAMDGKEPPFQID